MADVFHQWGSDLVLGPTGDLAVASASLLGQQRVLRRLLTSPGDYLWQLGYGAGLGMFVGSPTNQLRVTAVIRSQIFKEARVARTPEPVVDVEPTAGSGHSGVYVHLRYCDQFTGQTQPVSFVLGG